MYCVSEETQCRAGKDYPQPCNVQHTNQCIEKDDDYQCMCQKDYMGKNCDRMRKSTLIIKTPFSSNVHVCLSIRFRIRLKIWYHCHFCYVFLSRNLEYKDDALKDFLKIGKSSLTGSMPTETVTVMYKLQVLKISDPVRQILICTDNLHVYSRIFLWQTSHGGYSFVTERE